MHFPPSPLRIHSIRFWKTFCVFWLQRQRQGRQSHRDEYTHTRTHTHTHTMIYSTRTIKWQNFHCRVFTIVAKCTHVKHYIIYYSNVLNIYAYLFNKRRRCMQLRPLCMTNQIILFHFWERNNAIPLWRNRCVVSSVLLSSSWDLSWEAFN